MIQRMTSMLAMSAMLLHALLGCCWHHEHICDHGHNIEQCAADEGHDSNAVADGHHHNEHGASCADADLPAVAHHHATHLSVHHDGHENHESPSCPHVPCQHNCDDGECRFTQGLQVKTPAPDDANATGLMVLACGIVSPSTGFVDAISAVGGPPDSAVASIGRPMTQVWRL